eukprot:5489513-Prymnesium_polylepis.1
MDCCRRVYVRRRRLGGCLPRLRRGRRRRGLLQSRRDPRARHAAGPHGPGAVDTLGLLRGAARRASPGPEVEAARQAA